MFSTSCSLPAEQVLVILKCSVHFMNFTLHLIITITMLSKILGTFNAVFSYIEFSLRSLVKKVSIIYRHLAHGVHGPPLLMSVYARLRVQYVNPCAEWWRGGSTLSVVAGMCVINPYKRGSIVSATVLSDLSSLNALLVITTFFPANKKWSPCFSLFFFSSVQTNCIFPAVVEADTASYNAPTHVHTCAAPCWFIIGSVQFDRRPI